MRSLAKVDLLNLKAELICTKHTHYLVTRSASGAVAPSYRAPERHALPDVIGWIVDQQEVRIRSKAIILFISSVTFILLRCKPTMNGPPHLKSV